MMKQRGFITLPLMAWGAIAAGAVILALGVALTIQTSRLDAAKAKYDLLQAQNQVLADSLGRCNAGVENAAKAGQLAVGETRRLLGLAETAMLKTAALRDEARAIVAKPAPVRADGTAKSCVDAIAEIKARVKP